MNKIYKVVFNKKTGQLVAVQETAGSHGHGGVTVSADAAPEPWRSGGRSEGLKLRPLAVALWAAFVMSPLCFWTTDSLAAPVGASIQAGSASVVQSGLATTIRNTPGTIINWQSFNIAPNELVKFVQQNAGSAVLNRVVGAGGSELLGMLQSNGRVFLINGNGIVMGPQAQINTAGFVASTLNIQDRDFLSGQYKFEKSGNTSAKVVNQGQINAAIGGTVALIGGSVENSGAIVVDKGQVLLAAGQSVTLSDISNPAISYIVTASANEVVNLGKILANEGSAQLQGGSVSQSGQIRVDSATSGAGGQVLINAIGGTASVGGQISANNSVGKGGKIVITGASVNLDDSARISAVGEQGGGEVYVGGGVQGALLTINSQQQANAKTLTMNKDAVINVSAGSQGKGGHAVVWGDTAQVRGVLMARGGANGGDGGLIETSGHVIAVDGARISASAAKGNGGEWLIDPHDLTITAATTTNNTNATGAFTPTGDNSVVNVADINAVLNNGTSVTLTTNNASGTQPGNVVIDGAIAKTAGGNASLSVFANGTLTLNSSISSNVAALGVNLTSAGNMTLTTGAAITSNGGSVVLGAPTIRMTNATVNTSGGDFTLNNGAGNVSNIVLTNASVNTGAGNIALTANNFTMNAASALTTTSGNVDVNITQNNASARWTIGGGSNITTTAGNISLSANVSSNNSTASMGFLYGVHHISSANLTTATGNISISSNFTLEADQVVPGGTGQTRGGLGIGSGTTIAITGASNATAIRINANLTGAGAGVLANRVNALNIHGTNINISNTNGSIDITSNTSNIVVNGSYVGSARIKAFGANAMTAANITINGTTSVLAGSIFNDTTRGAYAYGFNITGTRTLNITGKVISPTEANYQAVGFVSGRLLGENISIASHKALSSSPNTTSAAGIYSYASTVIGNASTQNVNITLAAGGTRGETHTLGSVTGSNVNLNMGAVNGTLTVGSTNFTDTSLSTALLSGIHTNQLNLTAGGNGTVTIQNLSTVTSLNGTVGASNISVSRTGNGTVAVTGPITGVNVNITAPNATVTVANVSSIQSSNNLSLSAGNMTITTGNISGGNSVSLGGNITATNGLNVSATNNVTLSGNVSSNGTLSVTGGNVTSSGNLSGNDGVTLRGDNTRVTGGSLTSSLGAVAVGTANGTTAFSGNVSINSPVDPVLPANAQGSVTIKSIAPTIGANTTPEYLARLTADSIGLLSPQVLATMTEAQVTALSGKQIAALSSSQVAAFTDSQLKVLTPAVVASMTPKALGGLSAKQAASLNAEQVTTLNTEQVSAMLQSGSLSGLSKDVINKAIASGQFSVGLMRVGGQAAHAKALEVLPSLTNPVSLLASEQLDAVQNAQSNTVLTSK